MIQPQKIKHKSLTKYFRPLSGVWFRGIEMQYGSTPLQYIHTSIRSSRFSHADQQHPAFPLIYLAENHDIALKEVGALFNPLGTSTVIPNPHAAWTILNVTISLSAVLDLTDRGVQSYLQTNFQELTGDWRGYYLRAIPMSSVPDIWQPAPTQVLGEALYKIPKLMGFITVSAKVPDRKNLIIFPDKIKRPADGKIEFTEPSSGKTHQIS